MLCSIGPTKAERITRECISNETSCRNRRRSSSKEGDESIEDNIVLTVRMHLPKDQVKDENLGCRCWTGRSRRRGSITSFAGNQEERRRSISKCPIHPTTFLEMSRSSKIKLLRVNISEFAGKKVKNFEGVRDDMTIRLHVLHGFGSSHVVLNDDRMTIRGSGLEDRDEVRVDFVREQEEEKEPESPIITTKFKIDVEKVQKNPMSHWNIIQLLNTIEPFLDNDIFKAQIGRAGAVEVLLVALDAHAYADTILPEGWQRCYSVAKEKHYYHNKITNESSWDRPHTPDEFKKGTWCSSVFVVFERGVRARIRAWCSSK